MFRPTMKSKRNKVLVGIAAGIAAVGMVASPAFASVNQPIDHLGSPGDRGYINAPVTWTDSYSGSINGRVYDTVADGAGTYAHAYVHYDDGSDSREQVAYKHVTAGAGYSGALIGTWGGGPRVLFIDVWACNGGNIDGYGAELGGCYGRRYYNKVIFPNTGSVALSYSTPPGTVY